MRLCVCLCVHVRVCVQLNSLATTRAERKGQTRYRQARETYNHSRSGSTTEGRGGEEGDASAAVCFGDASLDVLNRRRPSRTRTCARRARPRATPRSLVLFSPLPVPVSSDCSLPDFVSVRGLGAPARQAAYLRVRMPHMCPPHSFFRGSPKTPSAPLEPAALAKKKHTSQRNP